MSDPITRLNAALEGRYRIERQLGEGGMATVYLADDLKHERKVALKVLKPELAAVVGAERFLTEIKTTANLQHPHILPLFDSGEADTFLFYVMPYVQGESLRERLDREHQLPVDEAVQIAKDVAEALQAAHDQGVIHRDVKPANILLSKGRPLVSDFGIALALGAAGAGRLTETGLSLGTPHYMSPEQATGDLNVGAATDTYALGCVLYEMLVGSPPFVGSTPQAVLGKIVTGQAPSAREERKSVPPNVDAAIRKALEKVPADRFASAKESVHALGDPSFRHGLATAGAGTGATGSRWTTTALVAGALVVGALGSAVLTGDFAPDEPEGLLRFTIEPGEHAPLGTFEPPDGVWPLIAISPAGDRIAYTGPGSDDSDPQLYLRHVDQLMETPLGGAEGVNPFFSPDDQWLGFITGGFAGPNSLYRISILGGAPVLVAEAEQGIPGADWGADDQIIFAAVGPSGGGLFRVAAGGGEPEQLTTPENSVVHAWPSIIDGEAAVLFTVMLDAFDASTWQVAALDLASREVTPLGLNGTGARYVGSGHLVYAAPDGSVRAVPFDPRSFEVSGSPVPLVENVAVNPFGGAAHFSVSAEGRLTYAAEPGEPADAALQLVWVDRDGRQELLPMPPRRYREPKVSPDGRRLATGVEAVGRTDLWVYDVSSGAGQQLSEHNAINSWPVWTPDGSRVYFSSDFEKAGDPAFGDIYSVPSDRSGPAERMMTTDEDQDHVVTDVTPDGRTLIYTDNLNRRWEIMGVPADGSGDPIPLVVGPPSLRGAAAISPNGLWMAYRSNESGSFDIYVQPYSGPGARVPVSIGGGLEPVWSADGSELYYRRTSDDMLMAAEIVGDATPEVIRRTELFSLDPYHMPQLAAWIHTFHVARDGRFLMMRRPPDADAGAIDLKPRIIVVLNWFEELRERVPTN